MRGFWWRVILLAVVALVLMWMSGATFSRLMELP